MRSPVQSRVSLLKREDSKNSGLLFLFLHLTVWFVDRGSYRNPEGLKYNHLLKYLLHLPITTNDSIQVIIILDSVKPKTESSTVSFLE